MSEQTKLRIQLKKFEISTSKEDILTLVSEFNPYPEKAKNGLLIWSMSHPTTNPLVIIKYPATGEVFHTSVPLSYPTAEEINIPIPSEEEPPVYTTEEGETHGRWLTLDEYMAGLSSDFVRSAMFKGADLEKVCRSMVHHYEMDNEGQPVFELPPTAFIKLVQAAFKLLDEGDYHTAAVMIDFGTHTGAYVIGKNRYFDEASEVFEYATWQLALDVCPVLFADEPKGSQRRGIWTSVNDVAGEIRCLADSTVRETALRQALAVETHFPQRSHLTSELEHEKARRKRIIESLNNRVSKSGENYLTIVRRFYWDNNIIL